MAMCDTSGESVLRLHNFIFFRTAIISAVTQIRDITVLKKEEKCLQIQIYIIIRIIVWHHCAELCGNMPKKEEKKESPPSAQQIKFLILSQSLCTHRSRSLQQFKSENLKQNSLFLLLNICAIMGIELTVSMHFELIQPKTHQKRPLQSQLDLLQLFFPPSFRFYWYTHINLKKSVKYCTAVLHVVFPR